MKVSKKLSIFFCAILSLYIPLYLLEAVGGSSITPPSADSSLVNLSSSSGDSSKPQVTMDPDGNGIVSWLEYNGTHSNIQSVAIFRDTGWSDPMAIASFPGLSSDHEHRLAADPAGNVHIVWHEPIDASTAVIKASMLPFKASKWSDPIALSNSISFNKGAGLSIDFSGNGMAAWTNDLGIIQTAPFIDGNWVLPAMDFLPSSSESNIKMAVDSKGNFVAVWEEIISNNTFIMGAKLPFKGDTWIPSIAPLSEAGSTSPQVATNLDGDASAVWVDASGVIQTSTSPFGSDAWSFPSDPLSEPSIIGSQPQIVIDFAGNTTIIWTAKSDEASIIQSAFRPFASSWLPSINISSVDGNASDPQIDVDVSGTVVAAWRNAISPDNVIVQFSKLAVGGTWTIPFNLSKEGEKAGSPQIAIANAENALVTWPNESLGLIQAVPAPLVNPVVASVTPNIGPTAGGTSVVITGANFVSTNLNVLFGTIPGTSITFVSSTEVTAVSPAHAIAIVDVIVSGTGGASSPNPPFDSFSFQGPNPPTVTQIFPTCGDPAGATSVTITGTNFSGTTAVTFGTVAATSFSIIDANHITATAPAGTINTTVDITVTNSSGTSGTSSADQYTYMLPPTVTGISPTSGTAAGGTSVVITGTNFIKVTNVEFGSGIFSPSFIVNSLTQITATSPAAQSCSSPVDVIVINCRGASPTTVADHFSYIFPVPTVTSVSPNSGAPAGGTAVTLIGTGFTTASAVHFGTVAASSFAVVDDSHISVTSPAAVTACATVDVTVTTCGGTSPTGVNDHFTYKTSSVVPTVTGVSPNTGISGNTVTITGTSFTDATAVHFGATLVTSFSIINNTTISATVPAGTACSTVHVTVTNCVGTSTTSTADQFTYTTGAIPTVSLASPAGGAPAGGTPVTITGTNFGDATAVHFGANPATSFTVISNTQINAISPAGTPCTTVQISVTNCTGTSSGGSGFFSYSTSASAPTVTLISPTSGTAAGGTSVIITGTNFTDASAVHFGAVAATSFTVNSNTQITAISPAAPALGCPSPVDITVTNCKGTSAVSSADHFTYTYSVPTITVVNPNTGTAAGGTTVTITGTNFIGVTAVTGVKFGTVNATSFTVNSPTSITATSPAALGTGCINPVDIIVTNCAGPSLAVAADHFTYTYSVPAVTAVSPNTGPAAGGTSVTITGTNFIGVTSVQFGTGIATFSVTSPTTIVATSPAASATGCTIPVDIIVTNCAGSSAATAADHFTYTYSVPTVMAVSPNTGPSIGGTSVTIAGTNFIGVTAVKFGTVNATSFTVNSPTSITALSPVAADCTAIVDITVTNCAGTSAIVTVDRFTYTFSLPTVTGVSPNTGPSTGGTSVTITGNNFVGVTAVTGVKFGTVNATSFTVNSPTSITATSPVVANCTATVDITVTNCVGTSTTSAADQFTYTFSLPTVTAVSPNTGPAAGGTTVTITGTNFVGVTAVTGVKFGSVNATTFSVTSPTTIIATSPAALGTGCINPVDITVTNCVGTSATSTADHFTYTYSVPTVTGVSPNTGPAAGGTSVTITGTNFIGVTSVQFGTGIATFSVTSPTTIVATSPAASATSCVNPVDIIVTNCAGTSTTSAADHFTYTYLAPTVTGVSPNTGPAVGGTSVTITGTNFVGVTVVHFGAVSIGFTVTSPTTITVTSPAASATNCVNPVDITVTNCAGTSPTSAADQFTYTYLVPIVTGVSPNTGPASGSGLITITGSNFIGVTAVKFGTVNASSFSVLSSTSISAVLPAASGTGCINPVDITVTNCAGTSATSAADHFTYTYSVPTVTGVSPNTGPAAGGTSVTIVGGNFEGVTAVKFGTINATSFTVTSPTIITAISPAASPTGCTNPVDITITNCAGTSSAVTADHFTYTYSVPTVTIVSPNTGPSTGATSVAITGANFIGVTAVKFGTVNATSFTVNSATSITATSPVPANCTTPVDITVTNCAGTSSAVTADHFTYTFVNPTVTGLSTNTGPAAGGTSVTITGTGFFSPSTVSFGGVPGTGIVVNSPTSITVTSPQAANCTNPVDVIVTSCGLSSSPVAADHFTYTFSVPTVTSVSPNSGSPAGGTSVAIVGTNFIGVSAVQFGGVNATSFTVNSPTSITAISPAGTTCSTVDIRVTNCAGTSAIVLGDKFSYSTSASIPTITNLNPPTGLPAGGTSVIITGTNFLDATAVHFGATPATSFMINSATQITAVAPAAANCTAVNVTVTNCVGTSTNIATFTYSNGVAAPVVTSINPTSGPAGTSVTINGTGFTNASVVKFGTISASFIVVTPVKITATAPAGISNCTTVDITVTTCAGTSLTSSADQFTYGSVPTVTGVTPNVGGISQQVTITGTNFTGTTAVHFGATLAPGFSIVNDTTITVDAPISTNCATVDITVTNCAGTSVTNVNDRYTYETEPAPTVTGVSPNSGAPAISVTITGTSFTGASAVMFGSTPATTFSVTNDSTITATVPAGTNCQVVDVRVTTCLGTSPANPPSDQFTYKIAPPVVTGLSPNTGAVGQSVIISGSGFTGATAVNFGTSPASPFVVVNDTTITVHAPTAAACLVDVTVTTCVGTSATSPADHFTYTGFLPPVVSGLSVTSGPPTGGTTVIITGSRFTGATAVNFGSSPATSFSVTSDTSINATSPAGADCSTVDVTVVTCGGTSATSSADQFTYNVSVPAPIVTGLSVSSGPPAGGTAVTINGSHFTGVTAVHFGTTSVGFTFNSDSSISVTSPAGAACSTVNVTVTTCGGTSATSPADDFTYNVSVPVPVVSSLSVNSGPPAGGTPVTISGSNFTGVSAVHFGGTAVAFSFNSDSSISTTSPAGTACSTVDVTVTTCGGTSVIVPSDKFSYNQSVPAPTVTGLSTHSGSPAGGTAVVITGTNFNGVSSVFFGSNIATINSSTNTTINVTSPAGTACGTVDVTVVTCGGTSPLNPPNDQFTYNTLGTAPTVTAVNPSTGTVGTPVTITGMNFTGASNVFFGATSAPGFVVMNDTTIMVNAPVGTNCTTVDVRVQTCFGTSPINSPNDHFSYSALPVVTSVSPSSGLPAGGTPVTITGMNFFGTTAVTFGGNPATNVVVVNDTTITADSPAGSECTTVDVIVTNCAGPSATTPSDHFSYNSSVAAPTVTSVSPAFGPPGGTTPVVITGMNFTGVTAVFFGSNMATINSSTSTTINVTSPAGTACSTVDVRVVTCGGTSAITPGDEFSYTESVPAPAVTGVSPSSGSPSGGTLVTISGTNFSGVTQVHFGLVSATINSSTATTVDVTAPAGVTCSTVDVTVTTCGGTSAVVPADHYSYTASVPAPAVTGVSPSSGTTGTSVTITGMNFTGTSQVFFGVISAPGFVIVNDSTITVDAPAGTNCTTVNITVVTCGGTSAISGSDQFTYQAAPVITGVSPSVGTTGTPVTITGMNFIGTTTVLFGSVNAPGFTTMNDTTITVDAPAGVACSTVDVRVFNCLSESAITPADEFTYSGSAPAPVVTSLSTSAGSPSGGTSLTIFGSNFTGVTAVHFGSTPATSFTFNSDTSITATSPAGAACSTVHVTVTTCGGTSATSPADEFTYDVSVPLPVVTSLSVTSGSPSGGTAVTINGNNFTGTTAVHFGANSATINTVTNTAIMVTSPAGTDCSTVDVTVNTCAGVSATSSADHFTYNASVPTPTVSGVSPNSGPVGTSVVITGTNFFGATVVTFGLTPQASFVIVSDTTITTTAPAGVNCSTVDVTVTTCGGTSAVNAPADEFTYATPPTVTGVSPNVGGIGQQVTITGTNLTGTTDVHFGGTPAAFVFVDDSTLTATAPISTNCDTVDITVTTCAGTSIITIFDQYTYETEPAPIVTGVSPSFGPVGESVTITGEFFTGASEVMFGSTPAPGFIVVNDSTITVDAPSGINCQVVDVRVTTCLGTSPANPPADQYTYKAMPPSPIVSGVSPTSGPVGQAVTITGSGFIGTTMVFFGTTATTNFIVVNDNDISVVAPAASDCLVDVRVLTCVGTSAISGADEFTYTGLPVPVVTSVTPNTGPGTGATSVVIKGMNFIDITAVDFGSVPATSFTVIDSMTIDAVSPPQAAGTCQLHVTVTGCAGTSVPSNNDIFIYVFMMANPQLVAAPTVTNVSPNTGPISGGNMVVITGTNFGTIDSDVTSVEFGTMSVPIGQYHVINGTTITAIVPALVSGNCTVDVIVATCTGGASTPTVLDQYTYQCRPIDPTGFTGCIIGDGFINKTSCTLGATWGASPSPNVVAYRIYRGDTIIAVIPVGAQFFFQTPLDGCTAVGFSITAVDSNGAESGHVPLVVVSG